MSIDRTVRKARIQRLNLELSSREFAGIARAVVDEARSSRLARHFPKLKQRLDLALTAVKVGPEPIALATRHVLCAEALVNVLEKQAKGPAVGRKLSDVRLMTAYARGVADRLRNFSERPASEQRRIALAYPEVNLRRVLRGCRAGIMKWESMAGVLEESHAYDILLKRLNQANLL